MGDAVSTGRRVTRVTCMVHPRLSAGVAERLRRLGIRSVLLEHARCVRQRVRARRWIGPGRGIHLDDAPQEIFRAIVPVDAALGVLGELSASADLDTPGRGALYAQDVVEYGRDEPPAVETGASPPARLLTDLSLLTGILSMTGSGERLARTALELGACVPVVSLGEGTGIRDRLGLVRITIPPEKEIVGMMVPRHDAAGIERLLIEDARMDRPGGGFLYRTPIRAGLVDPMLRIGPQDRGASVEQIIAAVDELKAGTAWRKRYADPDGEGAGTARPDGPRYREIVFVCSEGGADALVQAAMKAGAGGATTARVRGLGEGDAVDGGAARERGILCVPVPTSDAVVAALQAADRAVVIQTLDVPSAFSHTRTPNARRDRGDPTSPRAT